MINGDSLPFIIFLCAMFFAVGFVGGHVTTHNKFIREKQEQAEAEKQMQMWNDYLEALKGGQNAK